ncbi:Conserved_hypothetical protein [Hexamita inflata]|uniref:Transmembrane protein n=1 Tax=Hexamita inflata TaxID=28002 RepID=A0AA86QGL7_9EUKA|nr:Conserved hypothetical protein [Hexamita inflata]
MLFARILSLTCFTSNSSIILERQTNIAQLYLFPLTSGSEFALCQQLIDQQFLPSICFDAFCITGDHVTFQKNTLSVNIQCLSNCNQAFSASSASFSFSFPDTKTIISDAISNFKIENYNRLECVVNPVISYDIQTYSFEVEGTAQQCEMRFSGGQAVVVIEAYPDFDFQVNLDLTGVSTSQQLLDKLIFNCADFGNDIRWCQRMLEQFEAAITNYAQITINIPVTTVSSTGYDRQSVYSMHFTITSISSSFLKQFDCYSDINVVLFDEMLKVQYVKNASAVNCVKPLSQFVGQFDETLIQLQVQEYSDFRAGKYFVFTFKNAYTDFDPTELWLDCVDSDIGQQQCIDDLNILSTFSAPVGVIAWELRLNNQTTHEVQLGFDTSFPEFQNGDANISRTQFCFNSSGSMQKSEITKVHLQLIQGHPEFMVSEHAQVLDFRAQILFPTVQESYCFQFELDEDQTVIYDQFLMEDLKVTGTIETVHGTIGILSVKFATDSQPENYFIVVGLVVLVIGGAWLWIALKFV